MISVRPELVSNCDQSAFKARIGFESGAFGGACVPQATEDQPATTANRAAQIARAMTTRTISRELTLNENFRGARSSVGAALRSRKTGCICLWGFRE